MKVIQDAKLDFKDVLIVPKRSILSSRSEVELLRNFEFYHSPRKLRCIPIFSANMFFSSLKMAKLLSENNMLCALHKYHSLEEVNEACGLDWEYLNIKKRIPNQNVFMTIGMRDKDLYFLESFTKQYNYEPNICVDVPNAYIEKFVKFCEKVRSIANDSIIMAGNVVTPEMTQELIIYGGVDIVKLGIGPGSQCETRSVTGVGYPQISCSLENSIIAHGLKKEDKRLGLVCLDGGFRNIGDLAKGFCSGSDFLMTSSLLAGVEESNGEWLLNEDKGRFLKHYGMSSHYAQEMHEGVKKDYRASEGRISYIPYKGNGQDVINEILGGLRSTATYIGAKELKDFNRCGQLCIVK